MDKVENSARKTARDQFLVDCQCEKEGDKNLLTLSSQSYPACSLDFFYFCSILLIDKTKLNEAQRDSTGLSVTRQNETRLVKKPRVHSTRGFFLF